MEKTVSDYLTAKEAAERLNVTRQRIYQILSEGEHLTNARRFDYVWMIPRSDVEEFERLHPNRDGRGHAPATA